MIDKRNGTYLIYKFEPRKIKNCEFFKLDRLVNGRPRCKAWNKLLTVPRFPLTDKVAEGVETRDQIEHLRRMGCDHIQVYVISAPKPASKLAEYLKDQSLI